MMLRKSWWQRIQQCFVGTLMVVLLQSCPNLAQRSQVSLSEAVPPTCRTVQHELGESCIPLHPQRVIVMDQESLEILVALGVHPIAATSSNRIANKNTILNQKIKAVTNLGKEGQPNLEAIVRLKPDLIIGMYVAPQNYKLFSHIAPTVLSRSAVFDLDPAVFDRACESLKDRFSNASSVVVWIVFVVRRYLTVDFGTRIRRYLTTSELK